MPIKKGQVLNPKGRPKGSKTRTWLQKEVLAALCDDWYLHGDEAISKAREKDPVGYLRTVVSLLPKEVAIKRPLEDLTDADLFILAEHLRSSLSTRQSPEGDRPESSGESLN